MIFVISNQPDAAKGFTTNASLHAVHDEVLKQLGDAPIREFFYCFHRSEDRCECRKPKLGMVQRAAAEHSIDTGESFFVGDRRSDIELGHNAGGKGILVRTGYGEGEFAWQMEKWAKPPEFVAVDLAEAVEWILGKTR